MILGQKIKAGGVFAGHNVAAGGLNQDHQTYENRHGEDDGNIAIFLQGGWHEHQIISPLGGEEKADSWVRLGRPRDRLPPAAASWERRCDRWC